MCFLKRFKVIPLIVLFTLMYNSAFTQTDRNTPSGTKTFKNVKYIFCYPSGYGLEFNTLQYNSVVLSEDPGQGYTCKFPNPRGVMESLIKIPHPENKQQADSLSLRRYSPSKRKPKLNTTNFLVKLFRFIKLLHTTVMIPYVVTNTATQDMKRDTFISTKGWEFY
jgi:hypothetical protein